MGGRCGTCGRFRRNTLRLLTGCFIFLFGYCFKKYGGFRMAIARVSVLEFNSAEALEHAQRSHKEMREKVFPNIQMGLCVRTGPCSFIDISIYPSIEAAEDNLEERERFHKEAFGSSLKDEFFYQGDIDYFFQKSSFGDLNLTE